MPSDGALTGAPFLADDAVDVRRLVEAGAVRLPGCGSTATAVADGAVQLALTSDPGGALLEEASRAGVLGMLPSTSPGTGLLARDPAVARLALEVLGGGLPPATAATRVGVVEELVGDATRLEVMAAFGGWLTDLQYAGVEVVVVSVPDAPRALAAYDLLAGEDATADERAGAESVRRRLRSQVAGAVHLTGLLVAPTVADPASASGPWSVIPVLTGLPALSTPASSDTVPIGAMVVGQVGSDADILALAARAG